MNKKDYDSDDMMRFFLEMFFNTMASDDTDVDILYLSEDDYDDLFDTQEEGRALEENKTYEEKTSKDMVNQPSHYNQSSLETLEKFFLVFADRPDYIKGALLFNVIKYIDRAPHKGKKEEDEKKADFYLDLFTKLFPEEATFYHTYREHKKK